MISKSRIPSPKRRFVYKCIGQLKEKYLNEATRKTKQQCIKEYKSQNYIIDELAFHNEVERFWKLEHGLVAKLVKTIIPSLRY